MKILVFSDSHGNNNLMMDIIEENQEEFDCIFHLGDHTHDAKDIVKKFPDMPVYMVRGNNDMDGNVPYSRKVELEGVTFMLTHGHNEGVYFGTSKLMYFGEENMADVVVFGHIHAVLLEQYEGITIFNSGSITYPRDGVAPSFGVIEIVDGYPYFSAYRCTKDGILKCKL